MLTVSDLLKTKGKDVWSIHPEASTLEALRMLAEKNIGALLVIDNDALVGIVSERDIVRHLAGDQMFSLKQPVRDRMTSPVFTVRPDATIESCMGMMTQKHIRHLPVTNAEGKLVGLISIGDVVKAMISDREWLIDNLESYIRGGTR